MGAKIEQEYSKAMADAWRRNIAGVRDDAASEGKVRRWARARGMDEQEALDKFASDDMFAAVFAKDPSRQTIHQRVAAGYIAALPGIKNFETLPAGGSGAMYCVNGAAERLKDARGVKSIDFKWSYRANGRDYTVYASHKHTADDGGAQDNQYNDLLGFLTEATKSTSDDVLFVAICDGPYYDRAYTRDSSYDKSRKQYLQEVVSGRNRRATACQSDELEATLKQMTAI